MHLFRSWPSLKPSGSWFVACARVCARALADGLGGNAHLHLVDCHPCPWQRSDRQNMSTTEETNTDADTNSAAGAAALGMSMLLVSIATIGSSAVVGTRGAGGGPSSLPGIEGKFVRAWPQRHCCWACLHAKHTLVPPSRRSSSSCSSSPPAPAYRSTQRARVRPHANRRPGLYRACRQLLRESINVHRRKGWPGKERNGLVRSCGSSWWVQNTESSFDSL